jgi:glutamate dehydrogenase (NAD(P)+)
VVSYFEWLKNLSHVRFGRLTKKHEEHLLRDLLDTVERASGRWLSTEEKTNVIRGADELTLVNSGLEESMGDAYRLVRGMKENKPEIPDLRTAAFAVAIDKIATNYLELGIFP